MAVRLAIRTADASDRDAERSQVILAALEHPDAHGLRMLAIGTRTHRARALRTSLVGDGRATQQARRFSAESSENSWKARVSVAGAYDSRPRLSVPPHIVVVSGDPSDVTQSGIAKLLFHSSLDATFSASPLPAREAVGK